MRDRIATLDDVPVLAELNEQLTQDERHPHQHKGRRWFVDRMREFLEKRYTAVLFEDDGRPVAYALFRLDEESIYLRQFFVCRDRRREGVGRRAIQMLRERYWAQNQRITLGVLCENHAARAFWRAMGFCEYAMEMELPPGA